MSTSTLLLFALKLEKNNNNNIYYSKREFSDFKIKNVRISYY